MLCSENQLEYPNLERRLKIRELGKSAKRVGINAFTYENHFNVFRNSVSNIIQKRVQTKKGFSINFSKLKTSIFNVFFLHLRSRSTSERIQWKL